MWNQAKGKQCVVVKKAERSWQSKESFISLYNTDEPDRWSLSQVHSGKWLSSTFQIEPTAACKMSVSEQCIAGKTTAVYKE